MKPIPKITTQRQADLKRIFVDHVNKTGGPEKLPPELKENYERTVIQLEKWGKLHNPKDLTQNSK